MMQSTEVCPLRTSLLATRRPPLANLAEHIARDAATLRKLGWRRFVEQRRIFSDFASLDRVDHPAQRLLRL